MSRSQGVPTGRRSRASALVAILAVSFVTACSGGDPAPAVTVTVTEDSAVDKSGAPAPVVPTSWPLTGVPSEEVVPRPAVAVKIENSREARPQTGLDAADTVWEEVVEGGVTRYIAVYHSTIPETVGPIRSVRPMDANIAGPLAGLMVFSGGQPPFVQSIADVGLQVISHDQGAPGFARTKDRPAPHNVYGTMATFLGEADATHQAAPARQFAFADDAASATSATGSPVGSIDVVMSGYSNPRWTWDAASATFQRSEGRTAATTADGTRLAATNVVVLRVEVVNTEFRDPAGTPVPETQMIGTGEALVAAGGTMIPAVWSKPDWATPVTLTTVDGAPVELAPGRTWVELVPVATGSVTTG